jgi:hypothetical protein
VCTVTGLAGGGGSRTTRMSKVSAVWREECGGVSRPDEPAGGSCPNPRPVARSQASEEVKKRRETFHAVPALSSSRSLGSRFLRKGGRWASVSVSGGVEATLLQLTLGWPSSTGMPASRKLLSWRR